jgi:predicted transcriptional regulator
MAKKTISFKAEDKIKKALEKEAKKDSRKLSWFCEQIAIAYVKEHGLIKEKI